MNHRSLPFRLGAWYALLISVTFICVGAGAFYGLRHYLRMNLRDSLRRRSEQVEQILQTVPQAPSPAPSPIKSKPGLRRSSTTALCESRAPGWAGVYVARADRPRV